MSYIRNAWYVACWRNELGDATPFAAKILDAALLIYCTPDGSLVCLEDRCLHRSAPLSLGRCEGDAIRCMYHGILYAPSGAVVEIPGQETLPSGVRLKAYPIVERHGWVWVWMGVPELADEGLIPPAVGPDDPDWLLGTAHLDYAAEAALLWDNLTDFSHVTYVHANSFKAGADLANDIPVLTALERGVRTERWIRLPVSAGHNAAGQPTDLWQHCEFWVPGILMMWTAQYPAGTREKLAGQKPEMADAVSALDFTGQAVTPTGPSTSRYFYSWGPHRDHGGPETRDAMMGLAGKAFAEDKVIIEAQQAVIDRGSSASSISTLHDRGGIQFRRIVERLAARESVSIREVENQI